MDDIVVKTKDKTYNLRVLLTDWNDGARNIDITNILRLFSPKEIIWQQKKNNTKVEFTIEVEDLPFFHECPITKTSFDNIHWGTLYTPSIDRINPKLGYVNGNVSVIRYDWNTFKSNYGWSTFRKCLSDNKFAQDYLKYNYNSFKTQLNRFDINSPTDWLDQLTDTNSFSLYDGIKRMLINAEYILYLNGKIKKSSCLTILQYEPELLDA